MRGLAFRGGVAAFTALGALAIAWAIYRQLAFPPLELADRLVRLFPGDAATFAIDNFGKNGIKLLTAASVLLLIAAGAACGLLARGRRRRDVATAGFAFGVVLVAATLAAPVPPGLVEVLAPVIGGAMAYGLILAILVPIEFAGPDLSHDPDRRGLFLAAGRAGAVLAGTTGVLALLGRLSESSTSAAQIAAPDRVAKAPARPPFPKVPGAPPELTPVAEHYVVDIDVVNPVVDPDSWRLQIDGLADTPLELSLQDLQADYEVVEEVSVLTCISNEVGGPLIGNTAWAGVRLRDVLAESKPASTAQSAIFTGADGYTVTVPLDVAAGSRSLLAFQQGGEPLTSDHGSPCRVRIPALYGMMNAKWLERITLVEGAPEGYWAQRGWSPTGEVRTMSRIDLVPSRPRVGQSAWISGVAWAGERGISRVEVSTDNGESWERASLREPLSEVAWRQWAMKWTPGAPGTAVVACRATDGTGSVQTIETAPPHPDGATGYDRQEIVVS